jgi:hypothetical protein
MKKLSNRLIAKKAADGETPKSILPARALHPPARVMGEEKTQILSLVSEVIRGDISLLCEAVL